MGLFEFLMVLVSIIIGLGVTEILGGIANTVRARASVKAYWVHVVVVVALFIALLQQWWETWGLRDSTEWSFPALPLLLGAPVCLFLMADLAFPEPIEGADFREYCYGEMRPFWLLGAAAIMTSTSFRPIFFGQPLFHPSNATSFVGLAGFVALFGTSRHGIHAVLVPLFLVLIVLDVLLWSPVIGS